MKNKLDIKSLPTDPLELKGKLFTHDIVSRLDRSLKYIKTNYDQQERLMMNIDFADHIYLDCIKSDINDLMKVGFFPSSEAQMEFDHSLKHALIGSYKAAYSYLRRGLELTLTSVYLVSESIEREKAIKWIRSEDNTPFFSTMVEKLIKDGRFKDLNNQHGWKDDIKELYWRICDFTHVKGQSKGFRELNKTNMFYGGTSAQNISLPTLKEFLNNFIDVIENTSTILALYNPIILVGVPLDIKFGLNPPMSGLLYEGQAEIVNRLTPAKYKDFFRLLKTEDGEIKGIIKWFESQPYITDEEIQKQIREQDKLLRKWTNSKK